MAIDGLHVVLRLLYANCKLANLQMEDGNRIY